VLTANGANICSQPSTSPDCPNVGTTAPDMARPPACPMSSPGSASCQLPLATADLTYAFNVIPSAAEIVGIRVSDPAGRWVPAAWAVAAQGQRTFTYSGSVTGSGFLSYEGDNDFFTVPITAGLATPGGMTLHVDYTGPVELRVAVTRQDGDGQFCRDNCGIATAPSCSSPCDEPGGGCALVKQGGAQLDVWVNSVNFAGRDDRDPTGKYSFTVTYQEGCPSACPALWCN
jgi:hypothetical protein